MKYSRPFLQRSSNSLLLAVFICRFSTGCNRGSSEHSPSTPIKYGDSLKLELKEPSLKELWADFAHDCDWRLYGPSRVRLTTKDGQHTWHQVIALELIELYPEVKSGRLWDKIKSAVEADSNGLNFLLETWTGCPTSEEQNQWIAEQAHNWRDERDLIPLMLIELSQGVSYVTCVNYGTLEQHSNPGRMTQDVTALRIRWASKQASGSEK